MYIFDSKVMGKNIYHAGEIGSGNGAKICNNMSLGITMIAASEFRNKVTLLKSFRSLRPAPMQYTL